MTADVWTVIDRPYTFMRERIRDAKRVVVKLGSNLFFNEAGVIALGRIFSFIEGIGAARLS